MGRPACSWAALAVLLRIATCLAGFAVRVRSDVVGFSAAASVAPCAAVSESTPPMPSAFSAPSPVSSAFRFCDSLAHPASVTPVSRGGGFVLGQSAVDCTVSTESPLGFPLAPSNRLGGDLASLKIRSPAEIPPSSGAGDVLVAWEWNGVGGGMAMVVVMMMVVMSGSVVGGASDMSTVLSYCAAPVLYSRWAGSTESATSSFGGDFVLQLVGTRMYHECMGETGTGLPVRQPQPASTEQHFRGLCSFIPAGGLVTSCQDTDTPSTPAAVLPRAA